MIGVLAAEGIVGWVDGGWGVDALLGEQTRPHADLDLAVDTPALDRQLTRLRARLHRAARRRARRQRAPERRTPGRPAPHHAHPDGGGDKQQPSGASPWHYGPTTTGRIDGLPVPCNSMDTQLRSHLGYRPDRDDYADMGALARCPLPAAGNLRPTLTRRATCGASVSRSGGGRHPSMATERNLVPAHVMTDRDRSGSGMTGYLIMDPEGVGGSPIWVVGEVELDPAASSPGPRPPTGSSRRQP